MVDKALSKNDEAKAKKERAVFDLFLRLKKYPVLVETIKQSAPDIECEMQDGQKAIFELVTLDSNESSRRLGNFNSNALAF